MVVRLITFILLFESALGAAEPSKKFYFNEKDNWGFDVPSGWTWAGGGNDVPELVTDTAFQGPSDCYDKKTSCFSVGLEKVFPHDITYRKSDIKRRYADYAVTEDASTRFGSYDATYTRYLIKEENRTGDSRSDIIEWGFITVSPTLTLEYHFSERLHPSQKMDGRRDFSKLEIKLQMLSSIKTEFKKVEKLGPAVKFNSPSKKILGQVQLVQGGFTDKFKVTLTRKGESEPFYTNIDYNQCDDINNLIALIEWSPDESVALIPTGLWIAQTLISSMMISTVKSVEWAPRIWQRQEIFWITPTIAVGNRKMDGDYSVTSFDAKSGGETRLLKDEETIGWDIKGKHHKGLMIHRIGNNHALEQKVHSCWVMDKELKISESKDCN